MKVVALLLLIAAMLMLAFVAGALWGWRRAAALSAAHRLLDGRWRMCLHLGPTPISRNKIRLGRWEPTPEEP